MTIPTISRGVCCAALLVTAAAPSAIAAANPDFEYHGYMRSGIGQSRGGTDQVCFRAPGTEGASGKFRLGNECDTYVEAAFTKWHLIGDGANAPKFGTYFRLSAV